MSLAVNAPVRDEDVVDTSLQPKLDVYVLPAWIYRIFTSKFNLMEIHDYGKLRQVASLEDVAHLEILRLRLFGQKAFLDKSNVSISDIGSFIEKASYSVGDRPRFTEEEAKEISSTIKYMCQDERVVKEALNRLKEIPDGMDGLSWVSSDFPVKQKDDSPCFYKIVCVASTLYIIVEEGFLSRIAGKAARLTFFQQVLKAAYAALPISTVNRSVWYRNYVHALQKAGE